MATTWMVRAGHGGLAIEDFAQHGVAAVGWVDLGNLTSLKSKHDLRARIEDAYSDSKPAQRHSAAAQVGSFVFDMSPGDPIVSYSTGTREYLIGEIAGNYEYKPKLVQGYPHVRKVNWSGRVNRDDLSPQARNTRGAIQTLFKVSASVWSEIKERLKGEKPKADKNQDIEELEKIRADVLARAHEFIKDRVQKLAWDEMQDLVAGILRAMGYRTVVSGPGADRGKDIIASPDGLGLEQPRVRVEVKHRTKERIGAPNIRSFIGALRQSDRGLFISTGGFSQEAHYEAERSSIPVTLLDLDALVALLVQHYESVDVETRAMVPLVRFYWPAN